MNIHVFFNEGQKVLFDRYFKSSLKDNWRIIVHPISASVKDQNFGTQGFKAIIHQKMDVLVNEILPQEKNKSGFIMSDVDIQFFKPCARIIHDCLECHDIVFQRELPKKNVVNTGFIAMRSTRDVINFWGKILFEIKENLNNTGFINEQKLANELLKKDIQLNWGVFPDEIWAWSNYRLSPPNVNLPDICLHHANCTEPEENKTSLDFKIEQLELVKKITKSKTRYMFFIMKKIFKSVFLIN